jgi:hypothetical protein
MLATRVQGNSQANTMTSGILLLEHGVTTIKSVRIVSGRQPLPWQLQSSLAPHSAQSAQIIPIQAPEIDIF